MKKIFLILLCLPLALSAQFYDNFSDGNFTDSVTWTGTNSYFVINNEVLQSNGPNSNTNTVGDTIYLSTPNTMMDATEWSFLLDLKFNPTADNIVRIYLVSDNADLRQNLNGYFIEMGQTNADYVKFYKQSGALRTLLFTGTTAYSASTVKTMIKVTRSASGSWKIYSDPTAAGIIYLPEGDSIVDNTFSSTAYFGVYCQYKTDSRYNQYYFDDFYVGTIHADTVAPAVLSVTALNDFSVKVLFSESLGQSSAENTANYSVQGIGNPVTASRDLSNMALVTLTFSGGTFTQGVQYNLDIAGVRDLEGNTMAPATKTFVLYTANAFDIVVNEIMADPDPAVGLPNAEYLELYNRTPYEINLGGWSLDIGGTVKILPDSAITPGGYMIITHENNATALSVNGPCIGLSSFSLTNTGATIKILNTLNNVIHAVSYSDQWYNNTVKDDGGWSLEQIDPANPCGGSANWRASVDSRGGTPGTINSINGSNPDNGAPILIRASASRDSASCVKLFFNETMSGNSLTEVARYQVDYGRGNPALIKWTADYKSAVLYFPVPFYKDTIYTVTVIDSLFDCVGNKISANQTARFSIPVFPDSGDLVINEVLADPLEGGADFVEIYNRSGKVCDFADLLLLSLSDSVRICTENFLCMPGTYTVLTTKPDAVKNQYYTPNPYNFISMGSFISMNNDAGTVILTTITDTIIDAFSYTDDMHFPLLNSTDGVSLERISYDRPASDVTNWHSASEAVGFATPAYQNSQFMTGEGQEGSVSLEPEVFSPDNDGYNDVLNIYCKSDTPGKMINIVIYDAKGRQIKYLVRNQLMSNESVYTWDGITEGNQKANVGIYIVYVEMLGLDGKVEGFKKATVLATKL